MSGLFSLWAAVGSPLAALDHQLLTAHMAQHLLLMTVAAPLILLGAPAIALLHGLPQRFVRTSEPLCDTASAGLDALSLTPCFAGSPPRLAVIGWHVPALFELGMRSERWHAIRTRVLFRGRPSVLVACSPALAEPCAVASVVAFPCTFSWPRCRATRFRHFLRFVAASSTRTTCLRIGCSIFHLSETRSARAR